MNDYEKDFIDQQDKIIEAYKEQNSIYRNVMKEKTDASLSSNAKMFWVAIGALISIIVVTIVMAVANYKLQKSFIDFMNQYEYATEYTTDTYTITQDNVEGDNKSYINTEGDVKE